MAESGMNGEKEEGSGQAYPNENCHKAVRTKCLDPTYRSGTDQPQSGKFVIKPKTTSKNTKEKLHAEAIVLFTDCTYINYM